MNVQKRRGDSRGVSAVVLRGKSGQFYLITAVIFSTIIIGIVTVSNQVKKTSNTRIYDMKEELQIESSKVLDYGTNNAYSETQMNTLLDNFTTAYIDHERIGNVYFIYGTQSSVTVVAYQANTETVSFDAGSGETPLHILQDNKYKATFSPSGNTVILKINGFSYSFDLTQGENFYFALSQKSSQGGNYIVTG